jgi:hypothetical protein
MLMRCFSPKDQPFQFPKGSFRPQWAVNAIFLSIYNVVFTDIILNLHNYEKNYLAGMGGVQSYITVCNILPF